EFITLYGRRRVGKTYLIREFFSKKRCHFFHATGLQGGKLQVQLRKFTEALSHTFFDKVSLVPPKNWNEAFNILNTQIAKCKGKVVIFLDELPWLATRKSNVLQELDYYWNRYWAGMPNVILVVCGSSASWLIKKIIYNKGGLHNRTTCQMRLLPFTLTETKEYLKSRGVRLTNSHVLSLYMALGGIPYYLRYVEAGLSAQQNIQRIIFEENGPLSSEYARLFDSLFENAAAYKELVELISQKREGLSRAELVTKAKLSEAGGRLSERLQDLVATCFIEEYVPWGQKRGEYYKVVDEFCLFYLYFVAPHLGKKFAHDYWIHQAQRPTYYAWAGYAFEAVVLKHIDRVLRALDIQASSTIGPWRFIARAGDEEKGVQIDLVIDRSDNAVTLCEMKFTDIPFAVDKAYAEKLRYTVELFKRKTGISKQHFVAFIASSGLKNTMYSEEMVQNVVTLDDLF
ncbi:MAG: AAA family ATPase, partial [Verrucomicrobia bacterium]|nr:AAA family ATPase [Verrucomicrobiota bacterium]